ncbi:MAG: type II toxin-antitoxin system HicA family toxin [Chloroflexota bacterium]|nr:type II toxin-antitoxin system HicA family toxin [Chloroflexota bacterium]
MPPKIRQLKANLARAGFVERPAKGSHTMWVHPRLPETPVVVSGKDGDDAQKYQMRDVAKALKELREKL